MQQGAEYCSLAPLRTAFHFLLFRHPLQQLLIRYALKRSEIFRRLCGVRDGEDGWLLAATRREMIAGNSCSALCLFRRALQVLKRVGAGLKCH